MSPKFLPSADLANGQLVTLATRWVLVLASLFLIFMAPDQVSLGLIRFQVMIVLALAVANFYLCAQVLMKRKTLQAVVYGASLADLLIITMIIIAQGGFKSSVYVFYFPALLALSLSFSWWALVPIVGMSLSAYIGVSLVSGAFVEGDFQTLCIRVLMMLAVVVCGSEFQRIEAARRAPAVPAKTPEPLPAADALATTQPTAPVAAQSKPAAA